MTKQELLRMLPSPATAGFDLVTPRALQVWLALQHRSQEFGSGAMGEWTLEQLAEACGCNVNTASSSLTELTMLGWMRKSQQRHKGGTFGGFAFELRVPPKRLTKTARQHFQQKLDASQVRLLKRELKLAKDDRGKMQDERKELAARLDALVEQVAKHKQKEV